MHKRVGRQTVKLKNPPSIYNTASIVGPKEGQGPLNTYFDFIIEDELWGEKTWEKAESKLIRETFTKLLLVATGALLSPLTVQQGESIPSIAHAITIEKTL